MTDLTTARALADAADKAVEGATDQLLWALRFAARDPETGDDLYPGSFVHLSVEDCNLAAATIRDLVAEVERLRAEKQAVIAEDQKAGDYLLATPAALARAPEVQALVEACVKRTLEHAIAILCLSLWRHEGRDGYSLGMDHGARHQHEHDMKCIMRIAADPDAVKRIAEGRDE